MSTDELAWTPDTCSLPTLEKPLRVAEFDDLFSRFLREQQRLTPTRLRWTLTSEADALARDLVARETACCSFFQFTVSATEAGTVVETSVPEPCIQILDALEQRAAAGLTT